MLYILSFGFTRNIDGSSREVGLIQKRGLESASMNFRRRAVECAESALQELESRLRSEAIFSWCASVKPQFRTEVDPEHNLVEEFMLTRRPRCIGAGAPVNAPLRVAGGDEYLTLLHAGDPLVHQPAG